MFWFLLSQFRSYMDDGCIRFDIWGWIWGGMVKVVLWLKTGDIDDWGDI